MNIDSVLKKKNVLQRYRNWFVLDDMAFSVRDLYDDVLSITNTFSASVIFCDSCEANQIADELGAEEQEFLYDISGMYWHELNIVFIFHFDNYTQTLETLFHEWVHTMQFQSEDGRRIQQKETSLPYEQRQLEKQAFALAKEMMEVYRLR
ncbi:DUF3920 family protein [Priestia taiwanensis]|uniref:Uncharacterized protein n=1 Tax=Priestia taiwanensis TaxID=1347902 RepID=A0A917ELZ5_9BACI|nr:DUF3920 family protein [Priestia taiwanensis]MBM7362172.1 hypothetical protein [Priestia taiwanensis]GGE59953.1 hypothetical protein GCM10007140_07940 [Priestia taiwanensis]